MSDRRDKFPTHGIDTGFRRLRIGVCISTYVPSTLYRGLMATSVRDVVVRVHPLLQRYPPIKSGRWAKSIPGPLSAKAWIEGINKAERTEPREWASALIVADWQIHLRVSPPHP